MSRRLAAAVFLLFTSISCLAQVVPAAGKGNKIPLNVSLGGGMDYFSGDWGAGDINRWGPTAWLTTNMWHCLGINVEGHSMIVGGNKPAQNYKFFVGEGGLVCTMGYWGRFQPIYKGQLGYASLTHPPNGTGHFHDNSWTWSVGGGVEYHIAGHWWTRVDYTYEGLPDFHSSISGQNHTLNPQGISFGATYRFGPQGTRF
jgi:opacity protein-like surface antigen